MTDIITLSGPTYPPAYGGAAKQLVILLHGVGADGNDLIGLAPYWSRMLPEAEFVSPNAPFPCDMVPIGYQWFSLLDRRPERMYAGLSATHPFVDAFIDRALDQRGLTPRDLALVGFSQGTMTALHVALRRPEPFAALVGFSGALLDLGQLADEITARPPTLLIHGDADEVVPAAALPAAVAALKAVDVEVDSLVRRGLGHGIDPEGMTRAANFLKQHLPSSV